MQRCTRCSRIQTHTRISDNTLIRSRITTDDNSIHIRVSYPHRFDTRLIKIVSGCNLPLLRICCYLTITPNRFREIYRPTRTNSLASHLSLTTCTYLHINSLCGHMCNASGGHCTIVKPTIAHAITRTLSAITVAIVMQRAGRDWQCLGAQSTHRTQSCP